MKSRHVIAVLTDIGTRDPFVGTMKGVLASIAPDANVIDLSQEIPPGDVLRAGITLWQAKDYFPESTVFLCVIDPGVGTSRRGVIVQSGGQSFVGPDNGLFTFILGDQFQAWELSNPEFALPEPGTTFHGRDIFAPAAAYAALEAPGADFGPAITDLVKLPRPALEAVPNGALHGEILYADRFGNLLTSLGRFRWLNSAQARFYPWLPLEPSPAGKPIATEYPLTDMIIELPNGTILPWAHTFAELSGDNCGFLLGSSGLLEIVANRKPASDLLGLNAGQTIILQS